MQISLPYNFDLRWYQEALWKATVVDGVDEAFVIWPRRTGKDITTLNIVDAKAMQRVGLYLYIAPFFSQIRSIIWEGADNEGRRFLDYIPKQFIKQKFESRMTIELINGSFIKFAGADNMDSMMGGNPIGIVRTEASLHKQGGWEYLMPILAANKGWAIHNGCLLKGTQVYTPEGSKRIEDLKVGDRVTTGRKTSTWVKGVHHNGGAEVLEIETRSGYTLSATTNHKVTLQVGKSSEYVWRRMDELSPGDRVVMCRRSTEVKERDKSSYLLGLMFGDGSTDKNRLTITFQKREKRETILPWLRENYVCNSTGKNHRIYSKELWEWYTGLIPSGTKSHEKIIPDTIMSGTVQQKQSFIAGWLDTDGTTKNRQTKICTTSGEAAVQLQALLLSIGVKSSRYGYQGKSSIKIPTLPKILHNIECYGVDSQCLLLQCPTLRVQYSEYKGRKSGYDTGVDPKYNPNHLAIDLKQKNLSDIRISVTERSSYNELDWAMSGYFIEEIRSITKKGVQETFDIILDSPYAYLAEGFRTHNTPRGLNHFYTMAERAKRDPHTFFQHLTCEDTGYPDKATIQREREKGMPESLIQQEYYCSFLASSESTLIPLELIQPCISKPLQESDYKHEPRLIGVDPAYSAKGDQAIIVKRQGRFLHPLRKFKGVDNMSLADEIVRDIKDWNPHAVLIDAGRGEGVISRLGRLGYDELVVPVNFGGGAYNNSLYLNKRVEIWCRMRDWFMTGSQTGAYPSIPNDQNLITGLSTPNMDYQEGSGKIKLESKKEIRLRGAYVMDEPDALAVTFAEDLQGDHETPGYYGRLKNEVDKIGDDGGYDEDDNYDPLNFLNRNEDWSV